ncbi:LCP family protein [Falsibacillus albus]|uniref:Regulatory protein MsrR n=1 Tax=Falsibacillus albus TaxID=2478915 RepID=A0A3L7JVF3_9BACI|nr:LCP family protein [Falsibacillus albus]RLQ94224.1 LytR family transcriptional regulator [Falsibacillus albus]
MKQRFEHRRKKRKKRRLRIFFTIVTLFFLSIAGYVLFQYYAGKQVTANDKDIIEPQAKAEFHGQESKVGKTNILLLGVDGRGAIEDSNSDTMIIAQYDPDKNSVKMVSLMRDMFVRVPGYDGRKKMNSSFLLGGPELTRQTIKENFGIDIQYYIMVNFKGFEQAIDTLAPDGIEVNVEKAMSYHIGVNLQPGLQKLNGKELLGYARFRHDIDSDFGRVKRQQKVIKLVSDEVMSANGILKAPKLLGEIQPYIYTNMSSVAELKFVKDFLLHRPSVTDTMSLPVEDGYVNDYDEVFHDILRIDDQKNRDAINQFLN